MAYYVFTPEIGEEKNNFLLEIGKSNTSKGDKKLTYTEKLYQFLLKNTQLRDFFQSYQNDGELTIVIINIPADLKELPWYSCAEYIKNKFNNLLIIFNVESIINLQPIYADSPGNYLRIIDENSPENLGVHIVEAESFKNFLETKRVVVLSENEGRSYHWVIRLTLGILRKEKKNLVPFYFNESNHSYHEAFSALYSFLTEIHDVKGLKEKLDGLSNTHERLMLLTKSLHEVCFPVFIFENISSWFDSKGKPHYERRDITDWLYALAGNGGEHVIITTKNVTGEIARLPLFKIEPQTFERYLQNAIPFLEKVKKQYLIKDILNANLLKKLFEKSTGSEVILKLVVWLFSQHRELTDFELIFDYKIPKGLEKKYFLEQLLTYFTKEEIKILSVLAQFQMPVSIGALKSQQIPESLLIFLNSFILIDRYQDNLHDETHYYLSDSCRVFFASKSKETFDHLNAGIWHQSQLEEQQRGLSHLKEAYRHFVVAEAAEKIQQTGAALTIHYYKAGNYPVAHNYGLECYQKFKENTSEHILNCLALIFRKYKKPEESLFFFKILHEKYQSKKPNKKYIKILNYMSMLSFDLKELKQYITYGLEAYKFALQLKDKKEIYHLGKSLGRFLYVSGEKQGGLKMMQHSYQIGVSKGYADVALLEMFLREMGEM